VCSTYGSLVRHAQDAVNCLPVPHAVGQVALVVTHAYETSGAGTISALKTVSATPPLAEAGMVTSGTVIDAEAVLAAAAAVASSSTA
jgi:hypothetical protein